MLIGICGKKNAGKDTVFAMISALRPEAVRIGFADLVKDCLAVFLGVTRDDIEIWKNDSNIVIQVVENTEGELIRELTIRHALQRLGTYVGRDILGEDIWIDKVLPKGIFNHSRFVVITDVWFENEASRIRAFGGKVVEIKRPFQSSKDHMWWHKRKEQYKQEITHESESGLPSEMIDYTINNNGTLDDLQLAVQAMLAHLEFPQKQSERI